MNQDLNCYPLTRAQQSIQIIEQFHPGTGFVNIATTVLIKGEIDYSALNHAINYVLNHHDTFHIRLTDQFQDSGQYFQDYEIRNFAQIEFQTKDDYHRWTDKISRIPFSLYHSELFYFALIRIDDGEGGFYLKCHHIIADAWSVILLINQIIEVYQCVMAKRRPKDIQWSYRQRIIQEQNYLKSERFFKDKEFWKNNLAGVTEPMTFSNGDRDSLSAVRKTQFFSEKLSLRLKEFCSNQRISPFILLSAILSLTLWKSRGKETVVIGTTVLNRTSLHDKNTMGAFFNQLPFVIQVKPDLKFTAFVEQLNVQWMELLRHSAYPYVDILKDYRENHKAKNRLFDITLTFLNSSFLADGIPFVTERHFVNEEVSSLCVGIDEIDLKGFYNVHYDYSDEEISNEEIETLHHSLCNLLTNVIQHPNEQLAGLSLLSPEEERLILHQFNASDMEYSSTETILDLFDRQVVQRPQQTALFFGDQELSYLELDEKSNQLANYLVHKGIGKEEIVGLMLERSFDLVIGILGILKAGGAYLPIDPGFPLERISHMLKDSNSRFLISNCDLHDIPESLDIEMIHMENRTIGFASRVRGDDQPSPSQLAYVIYTSGSTGLPKGVMIEHKALNNFVHAMMREIDFAYKTIISTTTLSFDIFFLETILPVLIGMKVVIAGKEEKDDPSVLPALVEQHGVEVLQVTPSKMNIILKNPLVLQKFSTILIGGEALSESLLGSLKKTTGAAIYNMYGPTETTIWSSVKRVDDNRDITIGKPIGNTQFYIVDPYGMPLPVGITGEIYIAGDGLARGYWQREELTKERFVPNPFIPGSSMYKTGDLGRWLPNGEIVYVGRNDSQVKIRGFRIELGEIEKCLLKHENIRQAVVIPSKHSGKPQLCAYLSGLHKISAAEVRRHLTGFLPDYMVPHHFIWLDEIPLTPNGKVDRNSLPEPFLEAGAVREFVPPRNPIENALARIWSEVLGLAAVGVNDDFFVLGGDSLDILQILTECFHYNWKLSAQDFYEYPTVRKLADRILGEIKPSEHLNCYAGNYPDIRSLQSLETDWTFGSGDILLTGATGFFGIHVLKEIMENYAGKVYCLIRGKEAEKRLHSLLEFYFDHAVFNGLCDKRIIVLNGDISSENLGLQQAEYERLCKDVTSVIHSASLVKHFGSYADFQKINVEGTKEVIKFCLKHHKHLSYISTVSISGNYMTPLSLDRIFTEEDLYIGQDYQANVYIRSKFEAECLVLNAVQEGLQATIFRIGLLTGRFEDGKFQYNIEENALYRRLKSIFSIKALPWHSFEETMEFTPVDICAGALIKLLQSDEHQQLVYHLYNPKMIKIKDFVSILHSHGITIEGVPMNVFMDRVAAYAKTEKGKEIVSGIVNDIAHGQFSFEPAVQVGAERTLSHLKALGFEWPQISSEYLLKVVSYMENAGFLERVRSIG